MAYIYKIVNDINNKVYIGKTLQFSIIERWKEHCRDYKREYYEKRPLYEAMNKYGIEHFQIQQIEECSYEIINEREQYWIKYYNSYIGFENSNGYNATLGGDGKAYCDYELVKNLWDQGLLIKDIHEATQYDKSTISKILKQFNISVKEINDRSREPMKKSVAQIDKVTNDTVQIFPSVSEAYRFLNKSYSSHITEVCLGKRKTAYGYKWEFIN